MFPWRDARTARERLDYQTARSASIPAPGTDILLKHGPSILRVTAKQIHEQLTKEESAVAQQMSGKITKR